MGFADQIAKIQQDKERLAAQEMVLIEKAMNSNEPDDILKANQAAQKFFQDVKSNSKQKSILVDPFYFNDSLGYREKPISISDRMLRRMSSTPIVKAIIQTRVEQIARFSEPQPDKYSTGFVIKKRRKYGQEEEEDLNDEDKEIINFLSDFILNCGTEGNTWHGDNFDSFLRKTVQDSLTMDKYCFEVIRNRKGLPIEYVAVDSATVKICATPRNEDGKKKQKINGYYPMYCQVFDDQIITDFYPWELCFGIRNPTTDIKFNGYGKSELEDLMHTITAMLWSDEYNTRFFSQGSMPKGIMKVSSNVSTPKLAEFRQEWMSMISGVYNAHKTPMLEADKFEWVDLQQSNSDMEFSKWQEYLIKITCAIYKIDPSEIGFPLNGSADNSPMFEANNEHKLKYSKDKGLKPILKFIQNKINKYIIWEINPNYEFCFVGLDQETEQQEEERIQAAVTTYMEVNEARKLKGLPPKPEYDIILNPVLQQAQQAAMMGDEGSNEAVEGMEGEEEEGAGVDEFADEIEASMKSNPLMKDFMDFHKKEVLTEN